MIRSKKGINPIQAMRESSYVERLHCMPHNTAYPVGLHCYNMLCMLYVLWEPMEGEDLPQEWKQLQPPQQLVWAITFHDFGERWTGDTPYPAKGISQQLKGELDNLERFIEHNVFGNPVTVLPPVLESWLKALDLAELFCWAEDEIAMGNRHPEFMRDNCRNKIMQNDTFPEQVKEFIRNFRWHRTNDLLFDGAPEAYYGD